MKSSRQTIPSSKVADPDNVSGIKRPAVESLSSGNPKKGTPPPSKFQPKHPTERSQNNGKKETTSAADIVDEDPDEYDEAELESSFRSSSSSSKANKMSKLTRSVQIYASNSKY